MLSDGNRLFQLAFCYMEAGDIDPQDMNRSFIGYDAITKSFLRFLNH